MRCQAEGQAQEDDPDDLFLEWCICQILESKMGRLVRIGLSRLVHTLTGPAVTPCMMWGVKEWDIPKEGVVGVLEGTGSPLCAPSLHIACTEPREEKDLLLMLPRVCLLLQQSDGGYCL